VLHGQSGAYLEQGSAAAPRPTRRESCVESDPPNALKTSHIFVGYASNDLPVKEVMMPTPASHAVGRVTCLGDRADPWPSMLL